MPKHTPQDHALEGHATGTSHAAGNLTVTRETWADWLPNREPTLTVDELLNRARERGIDVDLRTLRSWQTQGVLPHPARRRMGAGTHAVYPEAALDFIADVREMQAKGMKLKEIGPRLRAFAAGASNSTLYREFTDTLKQAAELYAQISGAPVEQMQAVFTNDVGLETAFTVSRPHRWKVLTLSDE